MSSFEPDALLVQVSLPSRSSLKEPGGKTHEGKEESSKTPLMCYTKNELGKWIEDVKTRSTYCSKAHLR